MIDCEFWVLELDTSPASERKSRITKEIIYWHERRTKLPQALLAPTFSEIVFGFVYPVDTNVEPVLQAFRDFLTHQYKYKANDLRISEMLRSLDLGITFDAASQFELSQALIKAGNCSREKTDEDSILAVLAISKIAETRVLDDDKDGMPRERVAHLVRSLKRAEEVALFRDVYRSGFYLVGIANNNDIEHTYLREQKGVTREQAEALIQRDAREDDSHGQRMRDTFSLSDVFIQADENHYRSQVARFLELVFGHPYITPSREEHAMFLAYASAARSAQPGRQVGAAIASPEGDVVAVGMNEVPSPVGGLYWEGDLPDDRDHERGIDSNAQHRDAIVSSILCGLNHSVLNRERVKEFIRDIVSELHLEPAEDDLDRAVKDAFKKQPALLDESKAREAIANSELKQITEYGRAVHGEMDALLTCARLGISVKGKYLFVTTFPCHNCTRHIIASGIEKVFYIEPYPKSKAPDLHRDSIKLDDRDVKGDKRIPFVPFVGIGPCRYLDFFSLQLSSGREITRKDGQNRLIVPEKTDRPPRVPMVPLSFLEREARLQSEFKDVVWKLQGVPPETKAAD